MRRNSIGSEPTVPSSEPPPALRAPRDAQLAAKREDPRLRRLSALCMKLPQVERRLSGDHADFRVAGRVFAYFLNNHHGDGIVAVCCKSELGQNIDRASREPKRYYLPAYIGPRGWFGLRLDLASIDWSEVAAIVEASYRLVAPRRLVKVLGAQP